MGGVYRSRFASPARTGTTLKKLWHWWMRFPRCTANAADRGSGRTVCTGIARTTQRLFGALFWRNQFRPLRVRYDKRTDIHEAFLSLGSALICWQFLRKGWLTGLRAWPVRPFAGLGATTRISLD
jgi:hypothetical protein